MATSCSMSAVLSLLPLSSRTSLSSRPKSFSLPLQGPNLPISLCFRAHPLSHAFPAAASLDAAEADADEVFSGAHAYARWTPNGSWEDPDDGNDSGSEEMDYEEEEGSDGAGETKVSAVKDDKYAVAQYEDLMKEVELLLEPEEKAILQENEFPNVKKISSVKWNVFHSFALSGQIPLMDRLIEQGTEIDCLDKDGFTALHKAVIGKKEAVISHLLRKGANPHVRDRNGATPLHYAVQVGAMQTVKLLLKFKVDVNVADNDGWTPLHVAMQTRCRDIAKVLLINGADKTRRNKDGKTPLDLSLCYGKDFKSFDLARLLKLVPANRDL